MTGPIRAIMPGAVTGRVAVELANDWLGVTVSRLVPSASISATSWDRLDAEIPSTATIVAMPTAMPSAESTLLAGLITSPARATGHRSAGRIRLPDSDAAGLSDPARLPDLVRLSDPARLPVRARPLTRVLTLPRCRARRRHPAG